MYIRANSNRYKTFLNFRFISSFYLSIILVTSQIFLMQQANAAIGGWTMSNPIAQGASTVYNGTKNVLVNGKNVVKKGVATVTPTATNVAKVLARGAGGLALSVAVEQLLGAVDWVLDPANNQIKYTATCEATFTCPTSKFLYRNPWTSDSYSSPSALCAALQTFYQNTRPDMKIKSWTVEPNLDSGSSVCRYTYEYGGQTYSDLVLGTTIINPNYDPTAEQEQKTLPLDVVAQKVISNAQSGDTNAQVATTAAAADIVSEAETDNTKARPIVNQLESSAETATDETATGEATTPDTANPTAPPQVTNLKLEFPVFCGWAPVVCEAAQVVIKFPTTVTEWWETANTKSDGWATSISEAWTSLKEWAFTQPETPPPEAPLEIPDPALDISVTHYIQGNASCPNDREIPFSMGGHTLNLIISYSPLCTVAQQFKPAVVLMAFLAGAFIITNTGRRAEVGD